MLTVTLFELYEGKWLKTAYVQNMTFDAAIAYVSNCMNDEQFKIVIEQRNPK